MSLKRKRASSAKITNVKKSRNGTKVTMDIAPPRGFPFNPANAPRAGFQSVPRSRGASVVGEMKYFDTERTAVAVGLVTTTWVAGTILDPTTFNTLIVPVTGSAINQRIGRDIRVMKIKIRGVVGCAAQAAQATADAASTIRLMLVLDTQTNAAQMTSAQLMTDQAAADTTIFSFQNLNNFGRFRVIKDKIFMLQAPTTFNDAAGTGAQYGIKRTFKWNVKFRVPVRIRFNATNGGTVADIVDNSFHIVCGTDANGLAPLLSYVSRGCYKE